MERQATLPEEECIGQLCLIEQDTSAWAAQAHEEARADFETLLEYSRYLAEKRQSRSLEYFLANDWQTDDCTGFSLFNATFYPEDNDSYNFSLMNWTEGTTKMSIIAQLMGDDRRRSGERQVPILFGEKYEYTEAPDIDGFTWDIRCRMVTGRRADDRLVLACSRVVSPNRASLIFAPNAIEISPSPESIKAKSMRALALLQAFENGHMPAVPQLLAKAGVSRELSSSNLFY